MEEVFNNIDKVAGDPDQEVHVTVDIVWDKASAPFPYTADETSIVRSTSTRTDENGNWEMELVANADITPASLYKVTEKFSPSGSQIVYYINVTSPGPHWVKDILETTIPTWG